MDLRQFDRDIGGCVGFADVKNDGEVPVLRTRQVSLLHKTASAQFIFSRGVFWLTNYRILFVPKAKITVLQNRGTLIRFASDCTCWLTRQNLCRVSASGRHFCFVQRQKTYISEFI